jgi:hypothetical protein
MTNWLSASCLTLCAVMFLGLWIRSVFGIHDLEDQWDETSGPNPPISWFTNLKINRLSALSCILCDWSLTSQPTPILEVGMNSLLRLAWIPSSDLSSIRARPTDLEYLISIRQGFLPLRLCSYLFIEPYSPHRCAHQFGLDQDIPAPHLCPISLAADLEGIGWCYTHFFWLGTDTRYQMVSTSRASTFSRRYQ